MKRIVTLFAVVGFVLTSFAQQPNVLIFLVDDLRDELGCYDSPMVKSPNIDKLASQGVQFNNAYAQQAICAPSRMSIMTGLRPESFGIYDIFTKLRSVHPDVVTMPQLFKENGYKTISIGKVYHHGVDDQSSWTTYIGKEDNTYINPANETIKAAFEAGDVGDEGYKDGRAAQFAIDQLDVVKNNKFLMCVGFSKPHLPFNAPKKYWDLYAKNDIQIPSRSKPSGMYVNALTDFGELRGYGNIPAQGDLSDDLTKDLIHGYYACVSYVDAQVGKVMKKLDDLDLRKNTIVIFMSDHGYKIGEYGAWCKHSNMEIDVQVPLIISRETGHQGRIENVKSEALVENVDVFPTLIEVCGLVSPKVDGKSLMPLLANPSTEWDNAAYNLYPKGSIMGVSVTDGIWRYTEWRDVNTQAVRDVELYWHKDSEVVSSNLADLASYANENSRMKGLLDQRFPMDAVSFNDKRNIGNNAGARVGNSIVHMEKANLLGLALDGGSNAVNSQNVTLWTSSTTNVNQQWIEIYRDANYYSYQKLNTQLCLDGASGGENGQSIRLLSCDDNNQNQQFKKISLGDEKYRLEKRNASGYSIDGGSGGTNGQDVKLWVNRADANSNQAWLFTFITSTVSDVSLEDIEGSSAGIKVYSNPAKDVFTIDFTDFMVAHVFIYNMAGKLVYQTSTTTPSLQLSKADGFVSGIYLLKVVNEDQQVFHQKFIVK